ncbi:hypothetical protein L4D09_13545 [Photobacterium makurazakiensis]|uniref:hypothetical protein n=1 Tax=Photobacterium makurazakiensis TaxID=2910234 RepID=UPI003D0E7561
MIKHFYTVVVLFVLSFGVNTAIAQEQVTFNKVGYLLTTNDCEPCMVNGQLQGEPLDIIALTQEDDRSVNNEMSDGYILNALRRIMSSDQYASVGISPNYDLVMAFLPPPLLEIALTSDSLPKTQSHWTSRVSVSLSRLSGWKDGNTLYSHNHPRFS